MPQIVAAVLIGAGIAAGVKWLAKEVAKAVDASRVEDERDHGRAAAVTPKDLGALVYDAETGVYRPQRKRAS
jgi:hypothetical protein